MKKLLFCIIGGIIISYVIVSSLTFGKFQISFLDVGQGDSIFVRTPDDYTMLIDGGPDTKVLEQIGETLPLYTRTIDLLVLTHPHADHVNGLVEMLKRYDVRRALIVGSKYPNAFYLKVLELLKEKKIPVIFADSSRDIKLGSYVYLDILWPGKSAQKEGENINNSSLAMRILYGDKSIFLSGDAEKEEEKQILGYGNNLSADIFKAGHHGSRTASSLELLEAVKPLTAIIQSGVDNSYKHPHAETLKKFFEKGIEVRRNDKEGKIEFIF